MADTKYTTTQTGTPVVSDAHSLTVGTNGVTALHDRYTVEKLAQFNRERIPERIVHAKGGGAFGLGPAALAIEGAFERHEFALMRRGDQRTITFGQQTRGEQDERIGHPSCEGTRATGTHLHLARKYNGEWLPLDGMVPFVMSGWTAHAGQRVYEGFLIRGDQIVTAHPDGERGALIIRD